MRGDVANATLARHPGKDWTEADSPLGKAELRPPMQYEPPGPANQDPVYRATSTRLRGKMSSTRTAWGMIFCSTLNSMNRSRVCRLASTP